MSGQHRGTTPSLDSCAAEPIRIPGAIQPHGALLCLDPSSLAVLQMSRNVPEMLGVTVRAGMDFGSSPEVASLASKVRSWLAGEDAVFLHVAEIAGILWQVQGHLAPQGVLLEFEPPPQGREDSLESLYPRLRGFIADISASADLNAGGRRRCAKCAP